MENKILITYLSKSGSTEEISKFIANEFISKGYKLDLIPINNLTNIDEYDVILIGGPIFKGAWPKELRNFIKRNHTKLNKIKVGYFLVCLTLLEKDETKLKTVDLYLEKERKLVMPISEGRFSGQMEYKKLPFILRFLIKMMGVKEGKYIDFEKIKQWSDEFILKLGDKNGQ